MPELKWLGDEDAKRRARRVPYRMLEPVESVGDASTGNLLIQGDNLDALKALLPFFAGRVKCIFIDPPYNTKRIIKGAVVDLNFGDPASQIYFLACLCTASQPTLGSKQCFAKLQAASRQRRRFARSSVWTNRSR